LETPIQILFFCPRWGHAHLSWEALAARAKACGYDGIETDISDSNEDVKQMLEVLAKYNLRFIAQHWETTNPDFDQHKIEYEKRLRRMAAVNPFFINSQTGRDFFSFLRNKELVRIAHNVSKQTGIPVFHETHRGKFNFAAHVTADYLQQIPDLKLTLDISHWINVAETFLKDQPVAVGLAVSCTRHIHARVGHTQGPQVPDPKATQWEQALNIHLGYWDKVIQANIAAGNKWVSITPEFGPSPYMPLHPDTGNPVVDQWEVNVYMMELLKKRYGVFIP
jgi:hypothetical protein